MISFESVSLCHNNNAIVSDFNLVVNHQDKLLIKGKSGTGKTTVLKAVLGFQTIDQGKIFVNGDQVNPANIHKIRKSVFYLSQDIELKQCVVSQLLNEILISNNKPPIDRTELTDLLTLLELDKTIMEQSSTDLSGGERQRIGLLIGIILDRPIWLLDEPTSALDNGMKEKMAQYLIDTDKTIIIVSHDEVWQDKGINYYRWY